MEKNEYEELEKKHNLPEWKAMNRDFDIAGIEEPGDAIREVRRKMTEKLDLFIQYFGEILQADGSNMAALTEAMCLSEEERRELWEVYKQIMHLRRSATLLEITSTPEKEAFLINATYKGWQEFKPRFAKLIEKVRDGWKAADHIPSKMEYFG